MGTENWVLRQPRGATPRLRSGAAGRRHPTSEVRGGDPESHPEPEAKGGSWEEHPKERWLQRHRRAYRSYPTLKVRNSGSKKIPFVQGKEQRL